MICPECRYEYFSKKEIHLYKCPVCKSNFIKSVIEYSNDSKSLNLLRDAIRYLGNDSLKDKQLLLKLIPKLYHSDLILSKLLVISVNEAISIGIYNLINIEERDEKLDLLKQKLIKQAFLSEDAAKKIIDSWCYILDFDENENTIKNISNSLDNSKYLVNSKNEIIYVNDNSNFNIVFSEGLAYTGRRFNRNYINVKGESVLDLNTLLRPQFDKLKIDFFDWDLKFGDFHDGLALIKKGLSFERCGFINKKGKIIVNLIYDDVLSFSEQLAAVKFGEQWGYINLKGECVIKHKYDKAFQFSNGIALVKGNGNWTFIDNKGNIILSLNKYKDVEPFNEGLARVKNDKYGFINKQGREIIPLKYNDTESIFRDFIIVKLEKWGVINKNDTTIVPFEFDYVRIFLYVDLIIVGKRVSSYKPNEYTYGLYNFLGDELLKVEYNSINVLGIDNVSVMKSQTVKSFVDYDRGYQFEEIELFGLYEISKNKLSDLKYYSISELLESLVTSSLIASPKYEVDNRNYKDFDNFSGEMDYYEGIKRINNNRYISSFSHKDEKGNLLIDRYFEETTDFVNGIAKVKVYPPVLNLGIVNHKCSKYGFSTFFQYDSGYINKKGKWIYSERNKFNNNLDINHLYKYDLVIPNTFGLNSACINDVWCIVDNYGKEIIGLKYNLMYFVDENLIGYSGKINEGYKWGLMDRNERIITPCKYNNLPFFEGSLSIVFCENKVGCINKEGIETIPLIFDWVNLNPIFGDLYAAEIKNKWGVINIFGETVIDFVYDGIIGSNGYEFAIVMTKRCYGSLSYPNRYRLIDIYGTPILPDICQKIGYTNAEVNDFSSDESERNHLSRYIFHNGIVKFKLGNKWNFISIEECEKIQQNSEFLTETNFDFSEYEDIYLKTKHLEIIDEEVTESEAFEHDCEYDDNDYEYEYKLKKELKQDFIIFYESIVRGIYDEVGVSKNGFIMIKRDNKFCFINCISKEVVTSEYDFAEDFYHGLAKVNIGGKFVDDCYEGSNNLVFVGGKWGYLNEKFEVQIPIEFDVIDGFIEGVSNAIIEGENVQIDLFGNIISYL